MTSTGISGGLMDSWHGNAPGRSAVGRFATANAREWFAVELSGGCAYTFRLGVEAASPQARHAPYLLALYCPGGQRVAQSIGEGPDTGSAAQLALTAPQTGTYHVAVDAQASDGARFELRLDEATLPALADLPGFARKRARSVTGAIRMPRTRVSVCICTIDGLLEPPLRFELVGGNEAGFFEVDERTGELFFVGPQDIVPHGSTGIELTVRVSERADARASSATVLATLSPNDPDTCASPFEFMVTLRLDRV